MPVRPKTILETIRWFQSEQLTIYFAAFAIFLLGIWGFAVAPKTKAIRDMQKELSEKRLRLIGTEEAMKHIKDMDALLAERRTELLELNTRSLKPGQESSMIEIFTESAQALPINILNVQPDFEPPVTAREPEDTSSWRKEGFRKSKLTIHLQCRYQTLGALLERLSQSALSFEMEKVNMTTQEGLAPNLDIQMVLTAYAEGNI